MIEIHAARIGSCIRALAFSLRKVSPETLDSGIRKLFDRGHEEEEQAKALLRKDGYKVKDHPRLKEVYFLAKYNQAVELTGSPDGKIKVEGKWLPLEIKGLNPFYYSNINWTTFKGKLQRKYGFQLSTYCELSKSDEIAFCLKEKGSSKYKLHIIPKDRLPSKAEIFDIISQTFKKYPLPLFADCKYCHYPEYCKKTMEKALSEIAKGKAEVEEEDYDFLSDLYNQFKALKKQEKDLLEQKTKSENLIKLLLSNYGVNKLTLMGKKYIRWDGEKIVIR